MWNEKDPVICFKADTRHKFSGQKLIDIGSHFGIGVSGVSQASRRVALQIKDDKKLKEKIDKIILDLDLSTV